MAGTITPEDPPTVSAGTQSVAGVSCCCPGEVCCRWCELTSVCVEWSWSGAAVLTCAGEYTSPRRIATDTVDSVVNCGSGGGQSQRGYSVSTGPPLTDTLSIRLLLQGGATPESPCGFSFSFDQICGLAAVTYRSVFTPFAGGDGAVTGCRHLPVPFTFTLPARDGTGVLDPTQPDATFTITEGPCPLMGMAPTPMFSATVPLKPVACPSLGERLEFRADCTSGLMCEHRCTSTDSRVLVHLGGVAGDLRTVPGRDCGECPANPKNAVSPAPDTLLT